MELGKGYSFLSESRQYFLEHTADGIPRKFLRRIGEIQRVKMITDVMMSFHYVEETIRNSGEQVMILSDQILFSTIPLLGERVTNGVSFRFIGPKGFQVSQPVREFFLDRARKNALNSERVQSRFSDGIGAVVVASERQVGLIAFPTLQGGFDYKSFTSDDEECARAARIMDVVDGRLKKLTG
jgi:predicted transcriptional regulator